MRFFFRPALLPLALLALAGCSNKTSETAATARPADVKARISRLLPSGVNDREGWARDIYVAFNSQAISPDASNLCAVIAVTAQESNFSADATVPGLPRIAWAEIDRRARAAAYPVVPGAHRADDQLAGRQELCVPAGSRQK